MDRIQNYFVENAWLIAAVLLLGLLFAGNASAFCPGSAPADRTWYSCRCIDGSIQRYYGMDAFNEARANNKTCCGQPREPIVTYNTTASYAGFAGGGWLLIKGKWVQTHSEWEVKMRWLEWMKNRE